MIKADKAKLEISGDGGDIVFELNHIFEVLSKSNPEVIMTVSALWAPKMTERDREDYDVSIVRLVTELTLDYMKLRENKHDEE